jgi:Ni,Fe-hydrogenase I cytochrome b subunit
MKSILKHLGNHIIWILSIFDIAIVFWILWYEGGIQYEPLLEEEYNILSRMGLPTIPLSEAVYNTIIVAIVANMIVLIIESKKRYKRKYNKNDLIVAFIYFLLIMSFMLCGSFYISSRIHSGIINEYNSLFRFPIWIIGKDLFTNVVTVTRLYLSLCIIHLCVCFISIYVFRIERDYEPEIDKG